MDPADTPPPASAEPKPAGRGLKPSVLVFGLMVLAAGAFGLYGITRQSDKQVAHSGACATSLDLAAAAEPLVHGEVAALALATQPNPLGTIAFDDADGRKTTVASFKGKTILLNLWATWCVPCRAEMPALDKLQAQAASPGFSVVPVDIDTARVEKARAFFKDIGATNLPYYADNTADILQTLKQSAKVIGLPTTILIGADGCEIGTMSGPAVWDSPEAKALIARISQPQGASGI